jgi:hypothetical protein
MFLTLEGAACVLAVGLGFLTAQVAALLLPVAARLLRLRPLSGGGRRASPPPFATVTAIRLLSPAVGPASRAGRLL